MKFVLVNRCTKDGCPALEPADRVNMFWVDSYNDSESCGAEMYFHDGTMWYVQETAEDIDGQLNTF